MQVCIESLPIGQPVGGVSLLVLTRGVRLSRSTEAWGVQNEPLSLLSLQVAAKALETGVFGAYFNVLINLKDMTDDVFKEKIQHRISSLLEEAKTQAALVLDSLEARKE